MTDISRFILQKLNSANTGFACPVSNTEYILTHHCVQLIRNFIIPIVYSIV